MDFFYLFLQTMKHKTNCLPLTCQRISTDVVVCGVTERIVGASSGAGAIKGRRNGLNWAENVHNSRRLIWACAVAFTEHKHAAGCSTTEPLTDESKTAALTQHSSFSWLNNRRMNVCQGSDAAPLVSWWLQMVHTWHHLLPLPAAPAPLQRADSCRHHRLFTELQMWVRLIIIRPGRFLQSQVKCK